MKHNEALKNSLSRYEKFDEVRLTDGLEAMKAFFSGLDTNYLHRHNYYYNDRYYDPRGVKFTLEKALEALVKIDEQQVPERLDEEYMVQSHRLKQFKAMVEKTLRYMDIHSRY